MATGHQLLAHRGQRREAGRASRILHAPLRAAAAVICLGLLALNGCSASAPDSSPASPPGAGTSSSALRAFRDACAAGVDTGLQGRLSYPETLVLQYRESVNYNVALDVARNPLPPDRVIDVGEGKATAEEVKASCHVQAKLESIGDHTKIDGSDDSDWVAYDFSPTGVIEWAWTVTADEPVDQSVRLRVRPAVLAGEALVYGQNSEVVATTSVSVDARWYDTWSYYVTQTAAGVTAMVVTLSALIVLLATKGREVGKALRLDKAVSALRARTKGPRSTSAPAPVPPGAGSTSPATASRDADDR